MDADDGEEFEKPPGDYALISVPIRTADGNLGELKTWLRAKAGVARKDIRRFAKEYQRRTNWGKRKDLYEYFLGRSAETEEDLRRGRVSATGLDAYLKWDYSSYLGGSDVGVFDCAESTSQQRTLWVCPGCGEVIAGRRRAQYKSYHKKSRCYYVKQDASTYDRESSRCMRRVSPKKEGKSASASFSLKMTAVRGSADKKKPSFRRPRQTVEQ